MGSLFTSALFGDLDVRVVVICHDLRKFDEGSLKECFEFLSPEEIARGYRYVPVEARRQFFASRSLLRRFLAICLGTEPSAIELALAEHGKPVLAQPNPKGVHFNVSHTRGWAALALAEGTPVGVDVERVDPKRACLSIARRYFAPEEVKLLSKLDGRDQVEWFIRIWTLKEAYLKARGLGLTLPLKEFHFSFEDYSRSGESGCRIRIHFSPKIQDDPDTWQFGQRSISEEHIVAVAVKRAPGPDVTIWCYETGGGIPQLL